MRARATGRLERNDKERYRIAGIDVVLTIAEKRGALAHEERCLEQFEDFCIVTQSIRRGIPVTVSVRHAHRVPAPFNAKELANHVAWTATAEAVHRALERLPR